MKERVTKTAAKKTVSVLNRILNIEANSSSCFFTYQPKAPKELEKFRKK